MSRQDGDVEMGAVSSEWDIMTIFDKYADSGDRIQVGRFEDIIEKHRSSLTEVTIRKLLIYADDNSDGYISRNEMISLDEQRLSVTAKEAGVKKEDLTMFKKGTKTVANFILPNEDDRKLYYERYSCIPPPIFMIIITAAELSVFIYYGVTYNEWISYAPELVQSPLTFYPPLRHEVWRFLTYMFLHAGIEHVLFNLLIQLLLGIPLEMVHGGIRVGAIYLAGVLGGSLASCIFDPYTPLVGASGGVYALLSAQLANVIMNGDVMHKASSLIRAIFVILLLCADFGYSIYRRFEVEVSGSSVSFVAHVAGALAGLSVGLIVLRNFKKSLRDKVVFWISVGVYIAFMVFAIFWIAFWPYYEKL